MNGCYRFCLLSFADDSHPNHSIEWKSSIMIHVTPDQVIECDFALKLSLKLLLKKKKESLSLKLRIIFLRQLTRVSLRSKDTLLKESNSGPTH